MGEYVRFFLRGPLAMERADRSPLRLCAELQSRRLSGASAANTTLLIRTMTMDAESKAGGLVKAVPGVREEGTGSQCQNLPVSPTAATRPHRRDQGKSLDHQEGERASGCGGDPRGDHQDAGGNGGEDADNEVADVCPGERMT